MGLIPVLQSVSWHVRSVPRSLVLQTTAVILNWNGREVLKPCLQALCEASWAGGILVVDNGSADGSIDLVREEFPSVAVLENHSNLGYAEGNNRGIRHALENGADAVILLNNDVFVTESFMTPLVEALDRGASLAGPKILDSDRRDIVWSAGARVTYGKNVSTLRGHGLVDRGAWDHAEEVDYVPGAALLVHRRVFEEIGFLDPVYFCYMEDVDFCVRARAAGFRIRYEPSSVVYHRASSSTGGGYTARRKYMNAVNSIHFMRKHARWTQWLKFLVSDVATLPALFIWAGMRGRGRAAWAKGVGLWDGLRGVRITPAVLEKRFG